MSKRQLAQEVIELYNQMCGSKKSMSFEQFSALSDRFEESAVQLARSLIATKKSPLDNAEVGKSITAEQIREVGGCRKCKCWKIFCQHAPRMPLKPVLVGDDWIWTVPATGEPLAADTN